MAENWYAASLNVDSLRQGDILQRDNELMDVLRDVHPHYTDEKYIHFQVLTQSCDLVNRSGHYNSPYVTIAAVRDVGAVVRKIAQKVAKKNFSAHGVMVLDLESRDRAESDVRRLLNNQYPEYFFLPQNPSRGVTRHIVTCLRLSIAVRTSHYPTLLRSKVAELSEVFQARLGWLVGNLYSRVGTQDFDDMWGVTSTDRGDIYKDLLDKAALWYPKRNWQEVEQLANGANDPEALAHAVKNALSSRRSETTRRAHELLEGAGVDKQHIGRLIAQLKKLNVWKEP